MNQILDENEQALVPKKTFSKLSFSTSIITVILMFYYMSQIPSEIKVSDMDKPFISPLFAIAMLLSCALGFVFALISFVKKEPSNAIKWMGGVINIILFLVFIGSILLR